jgi:hypothetical protein
MHTLSWRLVLTKASMASMRQPMLLLVSSSKSINEAMRMEAIVLIRSLQSSVLYPNAMLYIVSLLTVTLMGQAGQEEEQEE